MATVTGRVFDPGAAVIVEATLTATNVDTGIETVVKTNEQGLYQFADLGPGNYAFSVSKPGFKLIVKPGVTLHVADTISMNFNMQVGAASETVTVEGGTPLVNTESAAVSTVVDRQFVENIPLNGRSFQSLIATVPGVTVAAGARQGQEGEFSVNGQRTEANYYMVDGVSANTGVIPGGAYSALPAVSSRSDGAGDYAEPCLHRCNGGISHQHFQLFGRVWPHTGRADFHPDPLREEPEAWECIRLLSQ